MKGDFGFELECDSLLLMKKLSLEYFQKKSSDSNPGVFFQVLVQHLCNEFYRPKKHCSLQAIIEQLFFIISI